MTKHLFYTYLKIGFRSLGMTLLFLFLTCVLGLTFWGDVAMTVIWLITVGAEIFGILEEDDE